MTDFNKGDFTQQGVDGHVNAKLRLNAKRYLDIDLTSNEQASGCSISGHVYDSLNNITYPIGSAPSGNIEITENTAEGSPLNIAQYATATVNVASLSNGVELIKTVDLGALQTESSTAVPTGQPDITINETNDHLSKYDLILLAAISDATAAGYNKATFTEIMFTRATDISTKNSTTFITTRIQYIIGSDTSKTLVKTDTANRGITTTSSNIVLSAGTLTIPTVMGYSASGTGTINANYKMYIFGITLSELPYPQV